MTTPGLLPLDLPLYSRLRQRVAAAPMTAAPGAAWVAWLQAQLRQGLSAHELAASGLEAWLAGQASRVPRAEVLARLAALPTEVRVLLPKRETPAPLVFETLERRFPEFEGLLVMRGLVDPCPVLQARNVAYGFHLARWHVCDLLGLQGIWRVLDARGRPWRSRHLGRLASPWFPSREAAQEWCEAVATRIAPGRRAGRPPVVRWTRQRLRGGSDYREWLLTLPGFRFNPAFRGAQHFDVPKLLMHLRTSVQGHGEQRLLFIEEIQSDYNQAISQRERRDGEKISDNAFQSHWVELGLRVAVLLACRQGLAGVATSNGAMHDLIYHRANAGRAAFYDEQVARALHKLARALDLDAGMTTVTGRTQYCLVTPVYEGMATAMGMAAAAAAATAATTAGTATATATAGGTATAAAGAAAGVGAGAGAGAGVAGRAPSAAAVRYWRITGGGQTTEAHLQFPSREQARRYAEVCLEREVVLPVPVLWLDAAARQRIYAAGLPVLGAVER